MSWHDYELRRPLEFVSVCACRAQGRRGLRLFITIGKGVAERMAVGHGDYVRVQFGRLADDGMMKLVAVGGNGGGEGQLRKLRSNSRSLRVEMGASRIIANRLPHRAERVVYKVDEGSRSVTLRLPQWVAPWDGNGGGRG